MISAFHSLHAPLSSFDPKVSPEISSVDLPISNMHTISRVRTRPWEIQGDPLEVNGGHIWIAERVHKLVKMSPSPALVPNRNMVENNGKNGPKQRFLNIVPK